MKSLNLFECALQGVQLIDASAGTGKTFTITGLVLRLLLEKNLPIEKILVVTYTEAATEELRAKTRAMIRQALDAYESEAVPEKFFQDLVEHFPDRELACRRLTDALAGFDQAAIFTIHGFCQRALKENSLETGGLFDTELVPDDRDLKEEVALDFWRRHFYQGSFLFVDYARDTYRAAEAVLLGKSLAQPDLRILPALPENSGEEQDRELEARFGAMFQEIQQAWPRDRDAVAHILLEDPGLKRNIYRPKRVQGLLAALDGLAVRSRPILSLFDKFALLTPTGMADAIKKTATLPDHPFFDLCGDLAKIGDELTHRFDLRLLALQSELVAFLRREMPARKEQRNVFAFDDLLTRLHDGLEGSQGRALAAIIHQRFPAALIDEFQDTDPVQYTIFSRIYREAPETLLFLIGDPKQAIYSFRGADIFTYMRATHEVSDRHTLKINYRSTAGLVQAVNSLFNRVTEPFLFKDISFEDAEPSGRDCGPGLRIDDRETASLRLCWVGREEPADGSTVKALAKQVGRTRILQQMAREIAWLLDGGRKGRASVASQPVRPGDIAVLVRTNREARLVQQALGEWQVPSALQSSESLFISHEAGEMDRLLCALNDPGHAGKVRAALLTDMLGVDGAGCGQLLEDDALWIPWLERFRQYHLVWQKHGFMRMFRELLRNEGVRPRLLSYADGERRLTNVLHLAEVLHGVDQSRRPGMIGLVKFLARQRGAPEREVEEYQLRLESDAERVRIVTIHKAKGLQYPVVFCPFCWEGSRLTGKAPGPLSYHDPDGEGRVLDLLPGGTDTGLTLARQEELSENLRLLYVAVTRAQHKCYLFWGAFKGAETSALAYLLHGPSSSSEVAGQGSGQEEAVSRFLAASDEELLADLDTVVAGADGAIVLGVLPDRAVESSVAGLDEAELALPRFAGRIDTDWKIASFSSLIRGKTHGADLPDRDSATSSRGIQDDGKEAATKALDIFSFPAGAKAGNFLHDLLEHVDFDRHNRQAFEDLVTAQLEAHGFGSQWRQTVCSALDRVLTTPLMAACPDLMLAAVPEGDRLPELEFHFPLAPTAPKGIEMLFTKLGLPALAGSFESGGRLQLAPSRGFLKGFIDLVFTFQGKFYLLDWKSNLLGVTIEDYRQERLEGVMREDYYHLQYHLYTLALHQYLATRLPGYTYETHFGGVFYLFLRGMDPDQGDKTGVFYDLPAATWIEELSRQLIG